MTRLGTANSASDVIIVGAGIVGCTIALRLAKAGLSVTVLERSVPGAEASRVAAGILGPAIEASAPGVALDLGLASRELHAALAVELREEHEIEVGFRRCGVMRVAFDTLEAEALESQARMLERAGMRISRISAAAAREQEPSLARDVCAAFDLPDEAQVDPRLLLSAIAVAAERAGARFITGAIVRRVRIEHNKTCGVELDTGLLDAPNVVVAAGSWTSLVPGLPIAPDAVFPMRGQIITTASRPPLFRRIIFGAGGYVVTRPDGRVLLGATVESAGFARETTLGGLATLIAQGTRVAPSLSNAPLLEHAVSFRPATRDHLPIIGRLGPSGLVIASGHHRNGILLAPVTASLVTDLIAHGIEAPTLRALNPSRFAPTP